MAEQINMNDMEYAWPSTGYDTRAGGERTSSTLRACTERLRAVEQRLCVLEQNLSWLASHAEPQSSRV